jgi:hypothetical protein
MHGCRLKAKPALDCARDTVRCPLGCCSYLSLAHTHSLSLCRSCCSRAPHPCCSQVGHPLVEHSRRLLRVAFRPLTFAAAAAVLYGVSFRDGEWRATAAWGECVSVWVRAYDARPRWRCLLPPLLLSLRNHAPAACMCGTIVGCALGALLPNNTSTLARVALALRYVPNDVTPLLLLPSSIRARYHDVAVRPTGVAEAIACYRQGNPSSVHIHIA